MSDLQSLTREIFSVLRKPGLVISLVSAATILAWIANNQVSASMWLFVQLGWTDEKRAEDLTTHAWLSTVLVICFVWINLHLLNVLTLSIVTAFEFLEDDLTNDYQNACADTIFNRRAQKLSAALQPTRQTAFEEEYRQMSNTSLS